MMPINQSMHPSSAMIYEQVTSAIEAPELARNARGKLRAALRCLPERAQHLLACYFVRHALSVLLRDDAEQLQACSDAIETILRFERGEADIREVERVNLRAITLRTMDVTQIPVGHGQHSSLIGSTAGIIQQLLFSCCCQRELEAAHLRYPNRYQPDAFVVAEEACTAVGRSSGQANAGPSQANTEEAAKARSRVALEAEAAWQLDRLLEVAKGLAG
jgi:hypothetical protein